MSVSFSTASPTALSTSATPTSPHHSHADPWALDYICCDSPHGASSSLSQSQPHSHSSPAPFTGSTPVPSPSASHDHAGSLPATTAVHTTGRAVSAHTGLAARKSRRPRPHALPGISGHTAARGGAEGAAQGHRRSQSHIDIPRVGIKASSTTGEAGQGDKGKGARSTPASAGSSPSSFGQSFVPFSLPLPALPRTGGGVNVKDGQDQVDGAIKCQDEQCEGVQGECCVDPACTDATVKPEASAVVVGTGVGVGVGVGHNDGKRETLSVVPSQSSANADPGTLNDEGSKDTMGIDMDTGTDTGLGLGAEGDELVKWACSEEGCAAIQKYLESCNQPDCHLPAIPLPETNLTAGSLRGIEPPHQSATSASGDPVGMSIQSGQPYQNQVNTTESPIEQQQRFYQSHVDNNNDNSADTRHAPAVNANDLGLDMHMNARPHAAGLSGHTAMPPPHMPHFHLSQAAPPDLSLNMMDIQHLLLHAQQGFQRIQAQHQQGQQGQLQRQHQHHHHHHHHHRPALSIASPANVPPMPTPNAFHSCGNPNCTAHLGTAATTPSIQASSPFALPTPPGQTSMQPTNTGASGGGTMTSGQLSSITPNGNPAAQLMREYQRLNSLQQHQQQQPVQQHQHTDAMGNATGAGHQLHHVQHSRHHTHHTHAQQPFSSSFPSVSQSRADAVGSSGSASHSASAPNSAALTNHQIAHKHTHSGGHGYNTFLNSNNIGSTWQKPPSFGTSLSPPDSTTQPFTSEGTPFQLSPSSLNSQSQVSNELSVQLTKELEIALGNSGGGGNGVGDPNRSGNGKGRGASLNGYGNEGGDFKMDYATGTVPSPMLSSTRNNSMSIAGPMSMLNTDEGLGNSVGIGGAGRTGSADDATGQPLSAGFQPHPTHICHWLNCHMAFASMPDLLAHIASDHLGAGLGSAGGQTSGQGSGGDSNINIDHAGVNGALSSNMWLNGVHGNEASNVNGPSSDTVPNQSLGMLPSNLLGQGSHTGMDQHQQFAYNAETDRLLSCLWDDCNPMPQECSAEEPGMCPPHPVAAANCNVGVENACCDHVGGGSMSTPAFGDAGGAKMAAQQDAVAAFQAFLSSQASSSGMNQHSQGMQASQRQVHGCSNQSHHHPHQHQHQHNHSHAHPHAHPHTHTDHSTGEPFSPQTMLRHVLEEHLGVPSDILGWDASSFAAGLGLGPPAQMHTERQGQSGSVSGVTTNGMISPSNGPLDILCGPTLSAAHARLHAPADTQPAPDLTCHWPDCPYRESFPNPAALMEHLSDVHVGRGENSYVCKWGDCGRQNEGKGRVFRSRQKVLRHLQSHTGHKPFICPECEQAFSEMAPLQAHLRRHKEEKPFVCEHEGCGKRFAIAGSLTIHMRTHNGEKPFVCPHCNKGFVEASNLTKHIRTHTGERPFACPHPGCGKCFPRPDQLKRHVAIHERNKIKGKVDGAGEAGTTGKTGKRGERQSKEGSSKEDSSESG